PDVPDRPPESSSEQTGRERELSIAGFELKSRHRKRDVGLRRRVRRGGAVRVGADRAASLGMPALVADWGNAVEALFVSRLGARQGLPQSQRRL
ncbi:MAG TPA: hypothetical protein VLK84_12535, partial [Longimicrobium sp.]|nr:hypothetical protein [Longimicrobium sp.]